MGDFYMKSVKDLFLELITETHLFEMAYDRKEAMIYCRGVSFQLMQHILKVYLFPEHQDYNHWKTEIRGWLNGIDDIIVKQKSRKLKFKDLYLTLYEEPVGHTDGIKILIGKMIHRKDIPSIKIENYNVIQKQISIMYYQLCDDLAIDKMEDVDYYIDLLKGRYA